MIETHATATEFRNNFAMIANAVAWRQDRCVVRRHGKEIGAFVSDEDLEFLRKHRPRKEGPPAREACSPKKGWREHFPVPPLPEADLDSPAAKAFDAEWDEDPWKMSVDNVKKYYELLKDENELWLWCARALTVMRMAHLQSQSSPHEDAVEADDTGRSG